VEASCTWSGMAQAPSKCKASGNIRHGRQTHGLERAGSTPAAHHDQLESGGPHHTRQAVSICGVDITLTLYRKHPYCDAIALTQDQGEGFAVSPAGMRLTADMEESCVLSALLYPCRLALYTERQLEVLDPIRGQVINDILRGRHGGCRPPCPQQCCICRTIYWVSK